LGQPQGGAASGCSGTLRGWCPRQGTPQPQPQPPPAAMALDPTSVGAGVGIGIVAMIVVGGAIALAVYFAAIKPRMQPAVHT